MADQQSIGDVLFEAAANLDSPSQRASFLDEACGDNKALREQVEELLRAHDQSQSKPDPEPTIDSERSRNDPAASMTLLAHESGTAALGDDQQGVLRSLGLADIPRVTLRDAKEEDGPIQRPNSSQVPDQCAGGRYQLQGEIARGGMGAIIKGRDKELGRDLAIKVLLDFHRDDSRVISRFVEEAQINGQLQHPGIAPVYDLGQFADQRPFFAMKLVKGKTLAALLANRRNPRDERAKYIGIFQHVCETMAYVHSRGVIHRDLKPSNIMVGAFGEVQVMDWGLSKVLSEGGVADEKKTQTKPADISVIQTIRSTGSTSSGLSGSDTQMGSILGTPAYMPPEQAMGEVDQLDERADVFGLGAIPLPNPYRQTPIRC